MKYYYKVTYESGYIEYVHATSIGPIMRAIGEWGCAVSGVLEIKRLKKLPAGVNAVEIED